MNIAKLYTRQGLIDIDNQFNNFLRAEDRHLAEKFAKISLVKKDEVSQILIDAAKFLEIFLVNLFKIDQENEKLQQKHHDLILIHQIRRSFVQRVVIKEFKEAVIGFDGLQFLAIHKIKGEIDEIEIELAYKINNSKEDELEDYKKYAAWAIYSREGKNFHENGALFILPQKIDYNNLIDKDNIKQKINPARRGFDLTDEGYGLNRVLAESNYCIFCHKQKKDSCRKGIFDNNMVSSFKKDNFGLELKGCPLDEKISEMNFLKSQGFSIASLAIAVIDNPMIAGTGHRICNDCMKSCIYQKQDPVNIPQIESRILKDVLSLPYGFEIYSLLTRWNPLNYKDPLPKSNSKKRILICGLGPAGYTLAHYLLNQGHEVVAIDGLKIEPLNPEISGVDHKGGRVEFKAIKYLDEIYEPLSERQIGGFGGVAEYGITSRWDKNFLKIIRLLLERRSNFRMFGGVRFGSSINDDIAFKDYGFDHIALCIGAGKPNIIDIENNFAKGINLASDFLMSLQLTGAFKEELFTNLQIRLPIIVIGGGLTAIDAACEAQAYYFMQIKKFANKIDVIGKERVWSLLNIEEKIIAEEFLKDFISLKKGELNFLPTKILYRKKIQDSPSYRLNHEELRKALEQGIVFIENKSPKRAILDNFGHIKSLQCMDNSIFDCKSLLIAAGTLPNISPVTEDNIDIKLDNKYFSQINKNNNLNPNPSLESELLSPSCNISNLEEKDLCTFEYTRISSSRLSKSRSNNINSLSIDESGLDFITKVNADNQAISFFGDLHPKFEGNVVKAMASAKIGSKEIEKIINNSKNRNKFPIKQLNKEFSAKIAKINRLSVFVIEIVVKAPLLAKSTKIGQIFRLQNFHYFAPKIDQQIVAMEGIPITALKIDKEQGLITGIVVETGGSTSLIKYFKENEPCIFMGPSGKATDIPKNETVIFIGGGRGNQPLTALAESFSNNNCRVIFFAGYKKNSFIVDQNRMENSAYKMIFAIEEERPNLKLSKKSSEQFHGNVIEAIKHYFSLSNFSQEASKAKSQLLIDRIFTIGNDDLMHEIAKLRHKNTIPSFSKAKYAITSLNSPMQCMMKGVCARCLQKRKNKNGKTEYFYSCAEQDQDIDNLDFNHLHYRCQQNSLSEKVSKLWINHLQKRYIDTKVHL